MAAIEVRYHWLAYTSWTDDVHEVLEELAKHIIPGCCPGDAPMHFRPTQTSLHGYASRLIGPHGVQVLFGRKDSNDIHVICPGTLWETLHVQRFYDLINDRPKRIARVDLKLSGLPLSPKEFAEMTFDRTDELRTKCNLKGVREDGKNFENKSFVRGANGDTAYMGNRESDRMVRLYNSRGTNDFELEIKGERAHFMTDRFEGMEAIDTADFIIGSIRDYVDFVVPGILADRSQAPLQEWWAEIVENISKLKVAIPIEPATMKRIHKWCVSQVATSLSLLVDVCGGDLGILAQLSIIGRFKRSARHEQILRMAGGYGGWESADNLTLPPVSQTGDDSDAALASPGRASSEPLMVA